MLNRRTLPLSALRAFESTGRYLHMGRAGEELGVTHGAISHQIRALEQQLGVKLFVRANSRLQLTDAGQRLLVAMQEAFDRILDGVQHLDLESLSGSLVIGCTQTAGAGWLANHACEFHKQYPQMDIHLQEIKPRQREIPREIDIAICYGEPDHDGRRCEELIRPDIFPVCSPRLLQGKNTVIRPEHITRFPLLYDSQNVWEKWFSAMDVPAPDPVRKVHLFNTNLALNAARQGHGLALCNYLEIREDLREGRLIQLLDRPVPESNSYYLLADKIERQTVRAQLFEAWIKEQLS